jgi:spore coat protein CotF
MNQQGQSAGQTNQSVQPSGQGTQLSDRDILQVVLTETKHLSESLNTYILEANNEQLRRDYMTALGDIYSQQKQIFDLMQQKGYYNVKNASPQDLQQAQTKFSKQGQGMQ